MGREVSFCGHEGVCPPGCAKRGLHRAHFPGDRPRTSVSKGPAAFPCSLYVSKMEINISVVQFSSVAQSCPALCDPMNRSTPGLPDHHQLPGFTQTHVHCVRDAIQPSHPLSSPSPKTFGRKSAECKESDVENGANQNNNNKNLVSNHLSC